MKMRMCANFWLRTGGNALLAIFWSYFAIRHLRAYMSYPRSELLVFFALETMVVVLFIVRDAASATSRRSFDWICAIAGVGLPLLFNPMGPMLSFLGRYLQFLGAFTVMAGVLCLNKSFGIAPAIRNIKTMGVYRIIRHPMYAGYFLLYGGYATQYFSARNVFVFFLSACVMLFRIANEERFLAGYGAYRQYQNRTRWKLLPYLY